MDSNPSPTSSLTFTEDNQDHHQYIKRISVEIIKSSVSENKSIPGNTDEEVVGIKLNDNLPEDDFKCISLKETQTEIYDGTSQNCFSKIAEEHSNSKKKGKSLTITSTKSKYSSSGLYSKTSEKKNYLTKVQMIQNRINKLKEQEEAINKKVKEFQQQKFKLDKLRQDKMKMKKEVQSKKLQTRQALEEKKQNIKTFSEKRKENLHKVQRNLIEKNQKAFSVIKSDKLLLETMKEQLKSHYSNINHYKCLKTKQETVQAKTDRFKKQAKKEEKIKQNFNEKIIKEMEEIETLKEKMKLLENVEEQCFEKLRQTMNKRSTELSEISKMKYGTNSSMIDLNKSHNKLSLETDKNKLIFRSNIRCQSTKHSIEISHFSVYD